MHGIVRGMLIFIAVALYAMPGRAQIPGRGDASPLFGALDLNGDGVLSQDEISNAASSLRKLDRDRNGSLELREMRPATPPFRESQEERSPASGFGGRSRGGVELEGAPEVGEKLPDLTLFQADGEPFRLGQLKDDYTVLVFGCLT